MSYLVYCNMELNVALSVYRCVLKNTDVVVFFNSFILKITDSRDAVILLVLHSIIQPSRRIAINKENKKNYWRPTINNSQDSFILHVKTENDVLHAAELRSKMYKEMGLGCQPYVIAVGTEIKSLECFFVVLENILYKFDSALKAVDTCFKIFNVLNIMYPLESELVWIFIENFFYKISNTKSKLSPTVSCIINDLK